MLLYCLDLLEKAKVKATFFATHETSINKEITRRGHILGIHPNFLPNSSQGFDTSSIIRECLSYAPNAWCMRTHSLVQSSRLLYEIFSNFPQLKLDVSLFMHRSLFAHKCSWKFEDISFDRLLYNWEDDSEFYSQNFGDRDQLFFGELTVCNFHPIHVFLNSSDGKEYNKLKEKCAGVPLDKIDMKTAILCQNKGIGVKDHLQKIMAVNSLCLRLDEV